MRNAGDNHFAASDTLTEFWRPLRYKRVLSAPVAVKGSRSRRRRCSRAVGRREALRKRCARRFREFKQVPAIVLPAAAPLRYHSAAPRPSAPTPRSNLSNKTKTEKTRLQVRPLERGGIVFPAQSTPRVVSCFNMLALPLRCSFVLILSTGRARWVFAGLLEGPPLWRGAPPSCSARPHQRWHG